MNQQAVTQKVKKSSSAAEERQLKKDKSRLERQLEKANTRISELDTELEDESLKAEELLEITKSLENAHILKNNLEEEWLQITLTLEA
jgi:ATP-binding cassette subfamily F protein uup